MTQSNHLLKTESPAKCAVDSAETLLISQLRNRDRKGYEKLYNNYSAALYGVIFRMIKNREMSEDILSEAFIKIMRSIELYDASKGRFFTWILNITRNLTLDKLRSKEFHKSSVTSGFDEVGEVNNMAGSSSINPSHIDVRRITAMLLPGQKLLIDLAFFKGYTYAEVAEELNIPLGTVKTRIRKAISTLRELYNYGQY
jgi:RNA polymerase sigma factor (sigma-70 family)